MSAEITGTIINTQTGEVLDLDRVSELKDNAMLKIKPELFTEWDFEKNDELDSDIWKMTKGLNKKTWWICPKCESSYDAQVSLRVKNGGCSYCSGRKANHTNSLTSLRPDLAKEWHPTLNGDLTPYDITCGSNKKVWWQCELEHSYESPVTNRNSSNQGCPYCAGNHILKGYNDMWTTNPGQASLLANPEDGYKYSQTSGQKVNWQCPNCKDIIKNKRIADINNTRLYCQKCNKGKSIPEMFIYHTLLKLGIEFEVEKTFNWSDGKRYDFYLPSYNTIVEVHGEQHYTEKFNMAHKTSLKQQIANDKFKMDNAITNNIERYTVVEARKSEKDYLINNTINSMSSFLNTIDLLDFDEIYKKSLGSRYAEVCDLWNNGLSRDEIAIKMKLPKESIARYLRLSKKR